MRRTVKRVIDGDTFEVSREIEGSKFVRIANYDAPETHQSGGRRATDLLWGLIGGRTVTIHPQARSYGRIVAEVFSNRRNVGNLLRKL